METIIEATRLTKKYGALKAVDDLSFEVKKGEVFAFLGQNGAGKSTTIRMLLTLIRPDSGDIRIFGKSLQQERIKILKKTGAIIEKPDLYGNLTGIENLLLFAKLNAIHLRKDELNRQMDQVGLLDRGNDKVRNYSQGMKQRLGLAVALVHDPELIILDEPTNGLDPQGIVDIRNLIRHLSRNNNKTIFISSHLLSEVEQLADQILIIEQGRKLKQGSVKELLQPEFIRLDIDTTDNERCIHWIRQSDWDAHAEWSDHKTIMLNVKATRVAEFSVHAIGNGFAFRSLIPRHSLENYFLSLVQ